MGMKLLLPLGQHLGEEGGDFRLRGYHFGEERFVDKDKSAILDRSNGCGTLLAGEQAHFSEEVPLLNDRHPAADTMLILLENLAGPGMDNVHGVTLFALPDHGFAGTEWQHTNPGGKKGPLLGGESSHDRNTRQFFLYHRLVFRGDLGLVGSLDVSETRPHEWGTES